jgi:plastocyanin
MKTLTALLIASVLVIAGCGGSGSKNAGSSSGGGAAATPAATTSAPSASGGGHQLALSAPASGAIQFDQKGLSAKAGTVTIAFDNPSSTQHAVAVEGNGIDQKSKVITQGKTSLSVKLKPGTYTFYCPVPGHRQAGMQGTLTVK